MKVGLYGINNLKIIDSEGKEIENFAFGTLDFNPYDPRGICRDHCVRIHFQWLSETFHWPNKDLWKDFYNASKSHKPVTSAGTSQVTVQKKSTREAVPEEGRNPAQDKDKRKVSYIPGGE